MVSTIVLAAGSGTRFGGLKQFASLHRVPLVWHAVKSATVVSDVVVVVVPEGRAWPGVQGHAVVPGGPTRAASVRRGVAAVPRESEVIGIHDAAHPLASPALFKAAIAQLKAGAIAAAPVLPVTETLGYLTAGRLVGAVPRDRTIVAVQSPQIFRADVLRRVLMEEEEVRDEISLFLARGYSVAVIPGDPRNIHVTNQKELELVARLLVVDDP